MTKDYVLYIAQGRGMLILVCRIGICLTTLQHSKRKRIFAERYAMTNVMKAKPLAAIHERAMAFVSQCAEAGKKSVDVYVGTLSCAGT